MSKQIDYTFNYEAEEDDDQSKQTNQFLAVLDAYGDHQPDNLKVKIGSANFGSGNYPDASKHRWLVRVHRGYSLSVDVAAVDLEKDLDTVNVYSVGANGEKKLVEEVNGAGRVDTSSNQLLVVFKSDCSVSRGGFSAVVSVAKNDQPSSLT